MYKYIATITILFICCSGKAQTQDMSNWQLFGKPVIVKLDPPKPAPAIKKDTTIYNGDSVLFSGPFLFNNVTPDYTAGTLFNGITNKKIWLATFLVTEPAHTPLNCYGAMIIEAATYSEAEKKLYKHLKHNKWLHGVMPTGPGLAIQKINATDIIR